MGKTKYGPTFHVFYISVRCGDDGVDVLDGVTVRCEDDGEQMCLMDRSACGTISILYFLRSGAEHVAPMENLQHAELFCVFYVLVRNTSPPWKGLHCKGCTNTPDGYMWTI